MAKCYAIDVHSVRAHISVELIDIDRTTKYMNVKWEHPISYIFANSKFSVLCTFHTRIYGCRTNKQNYLQTMFNCTFEHKSVCLHWFLEKYITFSYLYWYSHINSMRQSCCVHIEQNIFNFWGFESIYSKS